MKRQLWMNLDLVACEALVVLACVVLVTGLPVPFVRVTVGLLTGLLVPGYVLSVALFPHRRLDGLDRFALTLGLSVASVPMVALALDYTPGGITSDSLGVGLLTFISLLSALAFVRRLRTPARQRYEWRHPGRLVATLAVVAVAYALMVAVVLMQPAKPYTAFYVTSAGNKFQDFPARVKPGADIQVRLSVENREGRTASYRIGLPSHTQGTADIPVPHLANGATWTSLVSVSAPASLGAHRLDFSLYRDGATAVYRRLELDVQVVSSGAVAATPPHQPTLSTNGTGRP